METATTTDFSQKIYKKDSKGRLRVLHVYTEGADMIQESGLVDGEKVPHRKTCKAKNVGRANETTPEEQAISEAESKITDKLTTGYFNTMEEAKEGEVVLPMLAKPYKDESSKINWEESVFAQPKLDGMRCLAIVKAGEVTLMSRKGKVIENCDHIIKDIQKRLKGDEEYALDGEIYAHGLNFQENMRLVKKYRPGETEKLVYHLYDVVLETPYSHRYQQLTAFANLFNNDSVDHISCLAIESHKDLEEIHPKYLEEGYEGTIIRHSLKGYQINKRSTFLLKYKDFKDISHPIKDVVPNDANPLHGSFIFDWDGATGHPLGDNIMGCGMKFSHAEREEFLKNKSDYIGKTAELRYFEESEKGVPRFPVCVGIREDK